VNICRRLFAPAKEQAAVSTSAFWQERRLSRNPLPFRRIAVPIDSLISVFHGC
jgi:hypothetical protein